jgi:hypothetical protein
LNAHNCSSATFLVPDSAINSVALNIAALQKGQLNLRCPLLLGIELRLQAFYSTSLQCWIFIRFLILSLRKTESTPTNRLVLAGLFDKVPEGGGSIGILQNLHHQNK